MELTQQDIRRKVLDEIDGANGPIDPEQIAERLGVSSSRVFDTLRLLKNQGHIRALEPLKNLPDRIFIGHGRSEAWKALKDLLVDRLGLKVDEFDRESAAGLTITERLDQMLNHATFAFLVMTGEDERKDGTQHARENVIHELGLFQGRLGFPRAIILLEEGCQQFSNIHGLVHIRFPQNKIMDASERIRGVLERAGLIRVTAAT